MNKVDKLIIKIFAHLLILLEQIIIKALTLKLQKRKFNNFTPEITFQLSQKTNQVSSTIAMNIFKSKTLNNR